jgi:hypothetical protein
LKRQTANETEPPTRPEATCLHVFGHSKQVDHRASLMNQYCCSTKPEVDDGL